MKPLTDIKGVKQPTSEVKAKISFDVCRFLLGSFSLKPPLWLGVNKPFTRNVNVKIEHRFNVNANKEDLHQNRHKRRR